VPDAPGAPFKISSTTNNIVINWTAPTFDGGNKITYFNVYLAKSLDSTPIFYNSTSDALKLIMNV